MTAAELTERHWGIATAVAKKYARPHTDRFDELVGIGLLAIVEATPLYDGVSSSLETWLSCRVRWRVWNSFRRERRYREALGLVSLDAERQWAGDSRKALTYAGTVEDRRRPHPDVIADRDEAERLLSVINARDREDYLRRHLEGHTNAEIAKKYGTSPQAVQERLSNAQEKLEGGGGRGVSHQRVSRRLRLAQEKLERSQKR